MNIKKIKHTYKDQTIEVGEYVPSLASYVEKILKYRRNYKITLTNCIFYTPVENWDIVK